MALTLNQINGFETGGLEEASSATGSPDATEAVIVRSGERALSLPVGIPSYVIDLFSEVSNAGDDHIFGIGVYFATGVTPTSDVDFCKIRDTANTNIGWIRLEITGELSLVAGAALLATTTDPISADTWYFIEVYFQNVGSNASWEFFVNGNSIGSGSTADFATAAALDNIQLTSSSAADGAIILDDFYWLSGATASSDRLGSGFSVIPAQIGAADKTSDVEDDLASGGGNWVATGDRPWSDEADGSSARFENTGNLQGAVFFDAANTAGAEGGPSFGSSIVSGTIKGAKYMWRADRGTGSGKTHTLYYGSDNDTTTTLGASNSIANIAGPTSTTPANFFAVSESATLIPAATDNFAMGAGKSATGGQDTYIKEMMACLAHVSDTTVTDLSDGLMPEYPSPGLTVEV